MKIIDVLLNKVYEFEKQKESSSDGKTSEIYKDDELVSPHL
jgi:hypothetical protein